MGPEEELIKIGDDTVELSDAFPGCGLDEVGRFAVELGEHLRAETE